MNTTARIAIINWKEFHRAGLNKKRKMYHLTWAKKPVCLGWFGALSIHHYIMLNILRDLPPDRGLNGESEVFLKAWSVMKNDIGNSYKSAVYQKLSHVFGISTYELSQFVLAASRTIKQ